MLTRVHISSFIALTIAIWVLALWVQGTPELNAELLKPFGTVVAVMTFYVTMFNKYFWSFKIFRGWYVKRPDLRGSWKVKLSSNYVDPETGNTIPPISGYAVIRQSLTSLSFRLLTNKSKSILLTYNIEQQEDEGLYKLVGVYRNEPKIGHQGVDSEIHHGALYLDIHGSPAYELEGHYWTDRGTRGDYKLTEKCGTPFDTFEQCEQFYND